MRLNHTLPLNYREKVFLTSASISIEQQKLPSVHISDFQPKCTVTVRPGI